MPSTRWGFVSLERPGVELDDEEEGEVGDEDETDYYGGGGCKDGGGSGRSSHKNGNFSSQSGGGEGDDDVDDDDGEEEQLARDEAALLATSSARALVLGDSVHWKGADSDLPLGTVGLVTQVYGDEDVEVAFAGAQSDGKVFTIEEVISCATKAYAALWGVCFSCSDV
jgi:hypothetical protein